MHRSVAVAGLVIALSACGSGSSGNSATGTIGGSSLSIKDSMFYQSTQASDPNSTSTLMGIALSSFSNLCSYANNSSDSNSSTSTTATIPGSLLLFELGANANSIATGATSIVDISGASSLRELVRKDDEPVTQAAAAIYASPSDPNGESATSGTITLTSITSATVEGTYNVTFADGTLSGSFSAPVCNIPALTDQ